MSPPLIRYELDPTGMNPDNYVSAEPHSISSQLNIRAVAPTYGAFFTESMVITDAATNTVLLRGPQYICTELLDFPTEIYAKEVCYLILITDKTVSGNIRINYQALGGPYTRSADAIVDLYRNFQTNDRVVSWPDIIDKPPTFVPSPHLHDIGDVYGFEYLIPPLEGIKRAIELTNIPEYERVLSYITNQVNLFKQTVNSRLDQITPLNINSLSLVTKLTNGLMSSTDKVVLDNLRGAVTDSIKQYITAPVKQIVYKNELSFTPASTGILFCISSMQNSRTNDVSYSHALFLDDVEIDNDQSRNPTQQRIAKIVQGNLTHKIKQNVYANNDASIDVPPAISFGFSYIFIPTVAATIIVPPTITPTPSPTVSVTSSPTPVITISPTPSPTVSPTPSPTNPVVVLNQVVFNKTLTVGSYVNTLLTSYTGGPIIRIDALGGSIPAGTNIVFDTGSVYLTGTPTTAGTYGYSSLFVGSRGGIATTLNTTVNPAVTQTPSPTLAPTVSVTPTPTPVFDITQTVFYPTFTVGVPVSLVVATFVNGPITGTVNDANTIPGITVKFSQTTTSGDIIFEGTPTTAGQFIDNINFSSATGSKLVSLSPTVNAAPTQSPTPSVTTPKMTLSRNVANLTITAGVNYTYGDLLIASTINGVANGDSNNTGSTPPGMIVAIEFLTSTTSNLYFVGTTNLVGSFTSVRTINSTNGTQQLTIVTTVIPAVTQSPTPTTAPFTVSTNGSSVNLTVGMYATVNIATFSNGPITSVNNISSIAGMSITYPSNATSGSITLSGTPTTSGNATYSSIFISNGSQSNQLSVSSNVAPAVTQTPTPSIARSPIVINYLVTSTQNFTVGTPVNLIFATFTNGPINFIIDGTLPPGLTVTYNTGVSNGNIIIIGTPTVAGNYNYAGHVNNGGSSNSSLFLTTVVLPATTQAPTIAPTIAPILPFILSQSNPRVDLVSGVSVNSMEIATYTPSDVTPLITVGDALPASLTMTAVNGSIRISGITYGAQTVVSTYSFLTQTNNGGYVGTNFNINLFVSPAPTASTPPGIFSVNQTVFSTSINRYEAASIVVATFSDGPVDFITFGGSQISGMTGVYDQTTPSGSLRLAGTPTTAGSYTFLMTLTKGSINRTVSVDVTILPNGTTPPPTIATTGPFELLTNGVTSFTKTVAQYADNDIFIANYSGYPLSSYRLAGGDFPFGITLSISNSQLRLVGYCAQNYGGGQVFIELTDYSGTSAAYISINISVN